MKKPHLEITGGVGGEPLGGHCSSCPNVRLNPITDRTMGRIAQEASLKAAFQRHFNKVHLREDASQAAARVVREATENK